MLINTCLDHRRFSSIIEGIVGGRMKKEDKRTELEHPGIAARQKGEEVGNGKKSEKIRHHPGATLGGTQPPH